MCCCAQVDNRTVAKYISGSRGTADRVIALKDPDLPTRTGQDRSRGESIRPGAHNIDVWPRRDRHVGTPDVTRCSVRSFLATQSSLSTTGPAPQRVIHTIW